MQPTTNHNFPGMHFLLAAGLAPISVATYAGYAVSKVILHSTYMITRPVRYLVNHCLNDKSDVHTQQHIQKCFEAHQDRMKTVTQICSAISACRFFAPVVALPTLLVAYPFALLAWGGCALKDKLTGSDSLNEYALFRFFESGAGRELATLDKVVSPFERDPVDEFMEDKVYSLLPKYFQRYQIDTNALT